MGGAVSKPPSALIATDGAMSSDKETLSDVSNKATIQILKVPGGSIATLASEQDKSPVTTTSTTTGEEFFYIPNLSTDNATEKSDTKSDPQSDPRNDPNGDENGVQVFSDDCLFAEAGPDNNTAGEYVYFVRNSISGNLERNESRDSQQ